MEGVGRGWRGRGCGFGVCGVRKKGINRVRRRRKRKIERTHLTTNVPSIHRLVETPAAPCVMRTPHFRGSARVAGWGRIWD